MPPSYGAPVPARPANGMGITGMVLGILGTLLSFTVVLGFLAGVLGLVFALIGRGRADRGAATNGGQAVAGVILGSVAILLSIAFAVGYVATLLFEGCTSEGSTCTF